MCSRIEKIKLVIFVTLIGGVMLFWIVGGIIGFVKDTRAIRKVMSKPYHLLVADDSSHRYYCDSYSYEDDGTLVAEGCTDPCRFTGRIMRFEPETRVIIVEPGRE